MHWSEDEPSHPTYLIWPEQNHDTLSILNKWLYATKIILQEALDDLHKKELIDTFLTV